MNKKLSKKIRKFAQYKTEGKSPEETNRVYRDLKRSYLNADGRDRDNIIKVLNNEWAW